MSGALSLTGWVLAVLAALVVVGGIVALVRNSADGRGWWLLQIALALLLALAAGWVLDFFSRREFAAERRAFELRASELAARTFAPGSPLSCLDATAGETVEEACEKALFATPESTAAAVSYVAAQLALLAAARDVGRGSDADLGLRQTTLRRAIETDRFGIVAHVLALRGGCTANRCSAFALLQDASRVKINLVQRPFEARVAHHMASWPAAGNPPVAASPAAPEATATPTAAARQPGNNLFFPSASSIPPVNIMTGEPAVRPPADTTGTSDAAATQRKSRPAPPQPVRQQPAAGNSPAAPAAPLQIAPSSR